MPGQLVRLLQSDCGSYTLDAQQRLKFRVDMESVESRFEFVENLVSDLSDNTDPALANTA